MNAISTIEPENIHDEIASVTLADGVIRTEGQGYFLKRWYNGLALDRKLMLLGGGPLLAMSAIAVASLLVLRGAGGRAAIIDEMTSENQPNRDRVAQSI